MDARAFVCLSINLLIRGMATPTHLERYPSHLLTFCNNNKQVSKMRKARQFNDESIDTEQSTLDRTGLHPTPEVLPTLVLHLLVLAVSPTKKKKKKKKKG